MVRLQCLDRHRAPPLTEELLFHPRNGSRVIVQIRASPLEPLSLSDGLLNNSGRSVYGNYIGSRANTMHMLEFSAQHGIGAIVDVMPFARVNEAIERVRRRDVRVGLVLENRELDSSSTRTERGSYSSVSSRVSGPMGKRTIVSPTSASTP